MNSKLILAPTQPEAAPPDRVAFLAALVEASFIGQQYKADTYLAGKQFMQLLVFMGCAPNIETVPKEPVPDEAALGAASKDVTAVRPELNKFLLQIHIPEASASAQLYTSKQTKTPNCPACKQPLLTWRQETQISCLSCQRDFEPQLLNWRRSAASACAPIIISPIFQGEAVPSDALIQLLSLASSGLAYDYAYLA